MASTQHKTTQPAIFVPHGGGPMPILGAANHKEMIEWLTHFQRDFVKTKPDAIVLVTAHWEAPVVRTTSSAAPPLLYDCYNFPPEAYEIKYPVPGHPELAKRIHGLLGEKNIKSELDDERGYDHGVFIPLKLMYPDADIPVVQVSVIDSLDAAQHVKVGEALGPLRKENILIIGSGLSFHNFRPFKGDQDAANAASIPFHEYLYESLVVTTDPEERRQRLERWADAPFARKNHAREEHLLPLHVIAGAGLDDPCEEIFNGYVMSIRTSGYLFGART